MAGGSPAERELSVDACDLGLRTRNAVQATLMMAKMVDSCPALPRGPGLSTNLIFSSGR